MLTKQEWEEEIIAVMSTEMSSIHPYIERLQTGQYSKAQLKAWALNRYYYLSQIPRIEAVILSRLSDPILRKVWAQRNAIWDGSKAEPGEVQSWLDWSCEQGMTDEYIAQSTGVLPSIRMISDAWRLFCQERPVTQVLATTIPLYLSRQKHVDLLASMGQLKISTVIAANNQRLHIGYQAVLDTLVQQVHTPSEITEILEAVAYKCQMFGTYFDALESAYGPAGRVPAGAFDAVVQLSSVYQLKSDVTLAPELKQLSKQGKTFDLNSTAYCFIESLAQAQPLECLIAQQSVLHQEQSTQIQKDLMKLCRELIEKELIAPEVA